MEAGNDLKLSHAKYFRTFISKKIAKNCVKVEFLTNEEKRIFKFVDPPDGQRKNGKSNIWSYLPKDFAETGIL